MSDPFEKEIAQVLPLITELRHDLHAYPERCFEERQTARKVREHLQAIRGLKVYPPIIETDVVAVLNSDRPGPCIALRADIDALPMEEQADEATLSYRSKIPGMMHACGHDGHTAILVGTALALSKIADDLPGKVKFIFQPAEEEGGGGRKLCEGGVLENPKVDGIIALHDWPQMTLGHIGLRSGAAMASNDPFSITVKGKGSHGAYPQGGIDPICVAAHIVTALQTIVARTVSPVDSAVVTVAAITGGSMLANNIIPDECKMKGTMRHLRPEVGEHMRQRLREIAQQTALAYGAKAEVQFSEGYPPLINDEALTCLLEQTACDILGSEQVHTNEPPSMGVEDFAYYAQQVPAVMFRLGLCPDKQDTYPALHNSGFDFNDDALPIGIRLFGEMAKRFLTQGV